jgi:hypothetical protein
MPSRPIPSRLGADVDIYIIVHWRVSVRVAWCPPYIIVLTCVGLWQARASHRSCFSS